MKLFCFLAALLLMNFLPAQVNHTIYVIDSVPPADAEVQSALNVYKVTFRNGNDADLFSNFDTYSVMDSLYGKSWVKKLSDRVSANKTWADYVGSTKPITLNIDNWNWTKYEFYSIGLVKETKTKSCGYNLRCGLKTKQYSRKGKVTSSKMKNISKDE